MNEGKRRAIAVSLGALLSAVSASSLAATPDAEIKSRRLFKEAETAAEAGQFAEACPLFKAAHDLHATGGTALRTADCYEKIAEYDLALLHYTYIIEHSDTDKEPERVALAERRAAALRKQLGLDKPALLPVVVPPPLPPPPPPLVPNRMPAYIAFGVGGVGVVIGGLFGGLALSEAGDIKAQCNHSPPCPVSKQTTLAGKASAAKAEAWVSNVGFGLAVAGAATGAVLYVLKLPKAAAAVKSAVGPDGMSFRF